jgi:hypothetical protein
MAKVLNSMINDKRIDARLQGIDAALLVDFYLSLLIRIVRRGWRRGLAGEHPLGF